MPKINLDNLERYDGHLKDWCDARFAERKVHENWHESGPSGAVSFYPVPNRLIDPVVNFAFTETLPEGVKGPDNPSTIAGVTQAKVTRCGKNLRSFTVATQTKNGVTCTNNGDGTYTLNGLASADAGFSFDYASILRPGVYVLSGCPSGGSNTTYYLGASGGRYDVGNGYIINASAEAGLYFWIQIKSGYNCQNLIFKPQLELGSTATAFEPYSGADYTLPLGNTYYGGSIDLSTGLMTVTHSKVVLDGNNSYSSSLGLSENATSYGLAFYPALSRQKQHGAAGRACDRLPIGGSGSFVSFGNASYNIGVWLEKTLLNLADGLSFNDVCSAFNAFFTEYPTTIVYKLETPYTVQLTPTQIYSLSQPDPYNPRINTVYSDQQSVLVRYPKSPIITGSELDNAILSLGGD